MQRQCVSCIAGGCSFAAVGDTPFHFIKITGGDDDAFAFLQLPAGLFDVRPALWACCIGEHGAGIVINRHDWKEFEVCLGLCFHADSITHNLRRAIIDIH